MKRRLLRSELLVLALLAAAPACLPAGEPPTGQQIWAGRDRTLMGVLPARSPDDGVTRVLAIRPRLDLNVGSDLSLLSARPSGEVTDEALLEGWTCNPLSPCIDVDHRSRVFVWSASGEPAPDFSPNLSLSRIDLDTHERVDFGVVAQYAFSPSHRRVAVSLGRMGNEEKIVKVIEGEDARSVELAHVYAPAFVGEDLYFMGDGNVLGRLRDGESTREVVRDRVSFFSVVSTTKGPRLLLHMVSLDPRMVAPMSLLDPATGEERSLVSAWWTLSWDGQWAVGRELDSRRRLILVDLTTGTSEPIEFSTDVGQPEWRPGHAELWFRTDNGPAYPAFIKEPGKPVREVPATIVPYASGPNGSIFNRDGSRLFSYPPFDGAPFPTLSVGDADDLTGARFPLNPPGTRFTQYRELDDGRLVVQAFFRGPDRNDIYLIDPTNGATKLLGKEGVVVAAGGRRVLAMTHRVDQAGDLESIDLDADRSTLLAKEFVLMALEGQRFDDPEPLRPGARVAYQFRARFASPHDGIWVTTLP